MKKRVLITDLDNTLFDWVNIWYHSFSSMLDEVVRQTMLDPEMLKSEIREVHQRHGTSEYAFLLEEVPSLRAYAGGRPATEVFSSAIAAYRNARRETLLLYPTVMDALMRIRARGCKIIAYTESMAFYTGYRMRKLKLDGVIDFLFSPEDHDLPVNLNVEEIRKYPAENYNFRNTIHKYTPKGELKPNPHILQEIVKFANATNEDCVYVGDSLQKDIAMAKDAGIDHAWAKYGIAQDRSEYQLLREVTHWTEDDVERERKISARDVQPHHTLESSFSEIFEVFSFWESNK